jgi:hypothetical protein
VNSQHQHRWRDIIQKMGFDSQKINKDGHVEGKVSKKWFRPLPQRWSALCDNSRTLFQKHEWISAARAGLERSKVLQKLSYSSLDAGSRFKFVSATKHRTADTILPKRWSPKSVGLKSRTFLRYFCVTTTSPLSFFRTWSWSGE